MMSRLDLYRTTHEQSHPTNDRNIPIRSSSKFLEELQGRVGGMQYDSDGSTVMLVHEKIPSEQIHGRVVLSDLFRLGTREYFSTLFQREPQKDEPVLENLVFFDIESTGLSGGAGTKAFLVGVLQVQENSFMLTQYFLPNLSSERLFLQQVRQVLFNKEALLVSFNGKAYDFHILKNRFVLNHFELDEDAWLHLDLLHTSRRVWKRGLPDYTLQRIEREILKYNRKGDIPGYLIPDIYSRWLRGYNVIDELTAVFSHNRDDLLSLVGILVKQLGIVAKSLRDGYRFGWEDRVDPVALAGILLNTRFKQEALQVLHHCEEDERVLRYLAFLYKREKKYAESLSLFKKLSEKTRDPRELLLAYIEIAKLYEHHFRNIDQALFYTNSAIHLAEVNKLRNRWFNADATHRESLSRRKARLEKKMYHFFHSVSIS